MGITAIRHKRQILTHDEGVDFIPANSRLSVLDMELGRVHGSDVTQMVHHDRSMGKLSGRSTCGHNVHKSGDCPANT